MALAEPGGWIRPFVELGTPMADLLRRLNKQNVSVDHIEKILAAFRNDEQVVVPDAFGSKIPQEQSLSPPLHRPPSPHPQPLVEQLTNREIEVLELLAQRFQNKEIADKLSVSPETVRTHLSNIYQKLDVSNRRQAVEKAKTIGIL